MYSLHKQQKSSLFKVCLILFIIIIELLVLKCPSTFKDSSIQMYTLDLFVQEPMVTL